MPIVILSLQDFAVTRGSAAGSSATSAGSSAGRFGGGGRLARRLRRLAPPVRGGGGAAAARAGRRGRALGRRRAARLPRVRRHGRPRCRCSSSARRGRSSCGGDPAGAAARQHTDPLAGAAFRPRRPRSCSPTCSGGSRPATSGRRCSPERAATRSTPSSSRGCCASAATSTTAHARDGARRDRRAARPAVGGGQGASAGRERRRALVPGCSAPRARRARAGGARGCAARARPDGARRAARRGGRVGVRGIASSARSPTASCPARRASRSTCSPPSGSKPGLARRSWRSSSRITTSTPARRRPRPVCRAPGSRERARAALVRAAERALGLNAFASAARLYGQALDLWGAGGKGRAIQLLHYAYALWNAEVSGEAVALEARDSLVAGGDADGAAEAEALLSEMRWYRGDRLAATEHLRRAVSSSRPGRRRRRRHGFSRGSPDRAVLSARYADAVATGREALELAERLGLRELEAEALNSIGSARVRSGDREGIADVERAIEVAGATRAAGRRLQQPRRAPVRVRGRRCLGAGLGAGPRAGRAARRPAPSRLVPG